jgi:hypothetical protein
VKVQYDPFCPSVLALGNDSFGALIRLQAWCYAHKVTTVPHVILVLIATEEQVERIVENSFGVTDPDGLEVFLPTPIRKRSRRDSV